MQKSLLLLSNDLMAWIMTFLSLEDFTKCKSVCSEWNKISMLSLSHSVLPFTQIKQDNLKKLNDLVNQALSKIFKNQDRLLVEHLCCEPNHFHILTTYSYLEERVLQVLEQRILSFNLKTSTFKVISLPGYTFFSHINVFDGNLMGYNERSLKGTIYHFDAKQQTWTHFEIGMIISSLTTHPSRAQFIIIGRTDFKKKSIQIHEKSEPILSHPLENDLDDSVLSAYFSSSCDFFLAREHLLEHKCTISRMNLIEGKAAKINEYVLDVNYIFGYDFTMNCIVGNRDQMLHFFNEKNGKLIIKMNPISPIPIDPFHFRWIVIDSAIYIWKNRYDKKDLYAYKLVK